MLPDRGTEVRILQEQLNILGKRNEELRRQAMDTTEALQGYDGHLKALVDLIEFAVKQADELSMSVNILRRDVERGAAAANLLPFWEREAEKAVVHRDRLKDALVSLRALHADVGFRSHSRALL